MYSITESLLYDAFKNDDLKTVDELLSIKDVYSPISIDNQEKYILLLHRLNKLELIESFLNSHECERVIKCYKCDIGIKWPCCNQNKYEILIVMANKTGNMQLLTYAINYIFRYGKTTWHFYLRKKHNNFVVWLFDHYGFQANIFNIDEQIILLDYGRNSHIINDNATQIYQIMCQYRRQKIKTILSNINIEDYDYKNVTNIICDYI